MVRREVEIRGPGLAIRHPADATDEQAERTHELMALSVIIILYASIGLMAAAGSVFIARKLFSAKAEQTFFALLLSSIAAFYLVFTAYFGDESAWRFETAGVGSVVFLSLVGIRLPVVLITGYLLHGLWDVLHEIDAHHGAADIKRS